MKNVTPDASPFDAPEGDTPGTSSATGVAIATTMCCFLAFATGLVLTLLCTNDPWSLGPGDAVILAFMLGPYPALTAVAWLVRRDRWLSWATFLVTVVLAVWGLSVMGQHAYLYQTDPDFRKVQAIGVFLMPLGQWFLILCLGIVVAGYFVWRGSRRPR